MSVRKKSRFSNSESNEIMDTSIGSDGERSRSEEEETEDVVITPSNNEFVLKFSIENILKPEFGRTVASPTTPSPLSINGQLNNSISEHSFTSIKSPVQSSNNEQSPASLWPAWVYCTRYSDRPSSGPRCRRVKRNKCEKQEEKRPRTAFTVEQLSRLKTEFQENRYLTEKRRQDLAIELGLNESQIKIWFQNKRAKIKKQNGARNILALHLMAQGLYNHATIPVVGGEVLSDRDDEDDDPSNTNSD